MRSHSSSFLLLAYVQLYWSNKRCECLAQKSVKAAQWTYKVPDAKTMSSHLWVAFVLDVLGQRKQQYLFHMCASVVNKTAKLSRMRLTYNSVSWLQVYWLTYCVMVHDLIKASFKSGSDSTVLIGGMSCDGSIWYVVVATMFIIIIWLIGLLV